LKQKFLVLLILLVLPGVILVNGCFKTPPTQPSDSQIQSSEDEFLDDLGCFPEDCSKLPPGMKELCEDYKSQNINWPADCSEMPTEACRELCEREKAKKQDIEPVTFMVEIPSNSPEDTTVFLEIMRTVESPDYYYLIEMEKVSDFKWQFSLKLDGLINYRYLRNNFAYTSAEEFSPDAEDAHRTVELSPGDIIEDIVEKWRWYPKPGETLPEIDSTAETAEITNRVNGEEFQRGYMVPDFWWTSLHDLVETTNDSIKESYGSWVQVRPAWDYIQISPVPEIGYEGFTHVYPPEDLEFHLSEIKEAGFNIILVPQICCQNPDSEEVYSEEWWEAWFEEMNDYSTYFADIAEKYEVEYMALYDDLMWRSPNAPSDISDRYREYIRNIREHYSGKLGIDLMTGDYKSPGLLYPSMEELKKFSPEEFDFFSISMWAGVTDKNEPTVEEMRSNFKKIFDTSLKPLYDKYQKPLIFISAAYASIDGGMKGNTDVFDPDIQVYYPYSDKYELDLAEQAEGFEALMQAVAETPYIIGVYPFSYWYTPLPLTKEFNIRGKPSEQIVASWYKRFLEEGK
jgi:sugar phosphate isomerase/epimerase